MSSGKDKAKGGAGSAKKKSVIPDDLRWEDPNLTMYSGPQKEEMLELFKKSKNEIYVPIPVRRGSKVDSEMFKQWDRVEVPKEYYTNSHLRELEPVLVLKWSESQKKFRQWGFKGYSMFLDDKEEEGLQIFIRGIKYNKDKDDKWTYEHGIIALQWEENVQSAFKDE